LNRAATRRISLIVSNLSEIDGRLVCFFDGHCGLCNGAVRWLLRRDRRDRLSFAALESAIGAELMARHGINALEPKSGPATILVVRGFGRPEERVLMRSEAALALFAELPGSWPAVARVLGWIPRPVRDLSYRMVARWRYRIWGRLEFCPIPTDEERRRFL
jgi:predicted DCC family thiol-disulfide oxidoreductase YuxK